MNTIKKIISKRKSIRRYKNKEVAGRLIREAIDSARLAPSGNNAQPTRFFIVKDEETKAKLKASDIFKQDFVYNAPVIIVCCGDLSVYPQEKFEPGLDDTNAMRAVRDVAIAAQNLVLRATELGLGTCYIGWMEKTKIKKVLGIDNKFVVPFAITLGYPDEKPKARSRISLEEIIIGEL